MYDKSPLIKGVNCGFTFIEVMIAMAIISGVIVTLITSLNLHMGYVASSTSTVKAVMLATGKLNDLSGTAPSEGLKGDFGPDDKEVRWSYVTKPTTFSGVVKGEITVTWGSDGKVFLSTYKAE